MADERSGWYRQTQAEHTEDLGAPQRFRLTGDGLVTHRVIADGPFNGPDIGQELKTARYLDTQHQKNGGVMAQDNPTFSSKEYWDRLRAQVAAQQPAQQQSLDLRQQQNVTPIQRHTRGQTLRP